MPKISAEEYLDTQGNLMIVVLMIHSLPLESFLAAAQDALASGHIMDPTLYRMAAENLVDLVELAEAMLKVKQTVEKRLRKEEKKNGTKVQANAWSSGGN